MGLTSVGERVTQSAMREVAGENIEMQLAPRGRKNLPYNESLDEPATLIDQEPVEIETEKPAYDNQSVQTIDPEDSGSCLFEE